jgi:hypothetical protein
VVLLQAARTRAALAATEVRAILRFDLKSNETTSFYRTTCEVRATVTVTCWAHCSRTPLDELQPSTSHVYRRAPEINVVITSRL